MAVGGFLLALVGLVFVDITRRRLLERAQSDLIAMVSHDLRSPLGRLRARVDAALAAEDPRPAG